MEASLDTALETLPDATAAVDWLKAGWGSLTVEKALYTLALLLICVAVTRLVLALTGKLLKKADPRVRRQTLKVARAVLYILTALVVAGSLGVDVTSLIALVSIFALAVSLALQDMLSNVAAGLELLFAKPFSLGDYISSAEGEGTVAEIGLTHTRLDTYSGQRVTLPNNKLAAGKIVNYSALSTRRADHTVNVSYRTDPEAVRRAALKALDRTPNVLPDPAPQVVLSAYGESAIEYHIRFWTRTEYYWDAHFRSLEELRRAFIEDGVVMTYNHLNVHIVEQ